MAPVHPCSCVDVNNNDILDILRGIFTEQTLNNILAWLQSYWYIPLGIIILIVVISILLPITYRKKPVSKLRNTLRRRMSQRGSRRERGRDIQEAQTGGVGRNRRRGNRRQDVSNPRRLTESELVTCIKEDRGCVHACGPARHKGIDIGNVCVLVCCAEGIAYYVALLCSNYVAEFTPLCGEVE